MSTPLRYGATAAFIILVLTSGILHGLHTHRWVPPPPLDQYVDRLAKIPDAFGDWKAETGTSDSTPAGMYLHTDPATGKSSYRFQDDLRMHGIQEYVYYIFKHRKTTETYQVLVVLGRPGPIASHTPDVCYRGSGFTPIGEQKRADETITEGEFKGKVIPLNYMKFRPPITRPDATELEIRWAWMTPSKGLETPASPRIEYATAPALYKVYIIHNRPSVMTAEQAPTITTSSPLPQASTTAVHDAGRFLKEFLPRLEAALKDPQPQPAK